MELSEIQRWIDHPGAASRFRASPTSTISAGSPGNSGSSSIRPSCCAYGVGINDVINAINNNTANAGGGRVSRGDQSFIVRGVGLVHKLEDLGNVVVTQPTACRSWSAISAR